ncbi:MAG: hypothetical protein EOO06_16775 [Chitinophagaceae bacterium]|nr:MAG: hypothetical protein EOO06_16775 [Chitinophagaceae bacterium]
MELGKTILFCLISPLFFFSASSQEDKTFSTQEGASVNKRDSSGKQGIWYLRDSYSGRAVSLETYRNDTLHGYYENYWGNGSISDCGYYDRGLRDSVYIAYWENGNLRGRTLYRKGKLNGKMEVYNNAGRLYEISNFVEGELVSTSRVEDTVVIADKTNTDTVITHFKSNWNKRIEIYTEGVKIVELDFWKNRKLIESTFINGQMDKRIFYRKKNPDLVDKIYHYKNNRWERTEYFDVNGKVIKTQFNR